MSGGLFAPIQRENDQLRVNLWVIWVQGEIASIFATLPSPRLTQQLHFSTTTSKRRLGIDSRFNHSIGEQYSERQGKSYVLSDCLVPSRASGAALDVLRLAWCALMVRPAGRGRQLVSNVEVYNSGLISRRLRCLRGAERRGGCRVRWEVKNASAAARDAGADSGYRRDSGRSVGVTALGGMHESVCKRRAASSMGVLADRARRGSW